MVFRVLHHDNCFDGACSAAVFAKFHREVIGGAESYEYRGLSHGPAAELPDTIFGLGQNAIVDFKYSRSPRLHWWFDHHQSAFLTPALRADFEAGQRGPRADRQFFDEHAVSCTGLIARVASERFGFNPGELSDLLYWADIVDGARYASAQAAVEMREPAMQLTLAIENADSPAFVPRLIPLLTEVSLAELAAQPFVRDKVQPLLERHFAQIGLIGERAELRDGTIFFDLTDRPIEGLSKFIPYYLLPQATYTVALTRSGTRIKISAGTNPWTTRPVTELANIAAFCERFGGGGHARVGAVSFPVGELDQARAAAAAIVTELRRQGNDSVAG